MQTQSTPSDIRTILHARFDALLNDCDHVMDASAFGQMFHDLDQFLHAEGQKVLRDILEQKLQARIHQAEAAEEINQCPHCKKKRRTDTHAPKP